MAGGKVEYQPLVEHALFIFRKTETLLSWYLRRGNMKHNLFLNKRAEKRNV